MKENIYSVITGSGSYIPTIRVPNEDFLDNEFYEANGEKIDKPNQVIIEKFKEITTIVERRYVTEGMLTSDMAFLASEKAIESAGIDKEELDYIIVAHNFGDVRDENKQIDIVPSLASRVKAKLKIENPFCVAYDLPFGCPGWLQGVIQADYYLRSGDASKILIIGAEILSRVCDPHDRDSMIYADGAGAVILEAKQSTDPTGILTHKTRSDTLGYSQMLFMGETYHKNGKNDGDLYIKMFGRKLYMYALQHVPTAIKACLDKSNVDIDEVNKILIHQANGKMDDAIVERLYKLYGKEKVPDGVMPMIISWSGNSSVATIPTLYDLIMRGKMEGQKINKGDTIVFASVGAGMNINAAVYKA